MEWNRRDPSFDYDRNSLCPGNDGLWYSRGYIPHFDAPDGVVQTITIRLDDALPSAVVGRMRAELKLTEEWRSECINTVTAHELREREAELRKSCELYLDAGHGSCVLAHPECAAVVEDSLLWGDGQLYRLVAWCIMPTHLHVILEPLPGHTLGPTIKSIKRHTTKRIKQIVRHGCRGKAALGVDWEMAQNLLSKGVRVWQRESWDRFVRNPEHFKKSVAYVENNPVKAGLVEAATDWQWGSAGYKAP